MRSSSNKSGAPAQPSPRAQVCGARCCSPCPLRCRPIFSPRSNTKMTLEQQQITLEAMNLNREALEASKTAAQSMAAQTKAMGGVEAVDETMDAVEDGLNDAEEIAQALGRSVNVPGLDADEDDLLAELEGLEADDLADQLGSVEIAEQPVSMPSAPLSMPAAPTSAVKQMTDDERELAELEASMAM